MLFRSAAVAVLALAHGAVAQQMIAGYQSRTNVQDFLNKDLIQKTLEDAIGDEECASFDSFAKDFYDNGAGQYWKTIPTYDGTISAEYEEMTKYYNKPDFIQKWIDAALRKKKTQFTRGNQNFGLAFPNNVGTDGGCVGFEEVLKKGISYTSTLAEMYQLMQKAIDAANGTLTGTPCRAQVNGCQDAILNWDAAVAIYVGSLEGVDGGNDVAGSYGKSSYALADKRARNFEVGGPDRNGNTKDLTAPANTAILALMSAGSHAAYVGDYQLMAKYLRLVSNKSLVPLLQGTFRYFSRLSDDGGVGTFSSLDKEVAEGAAFAFGALPKLWACSTKGAKKAEKEIKIGTTSNKGPGKTAINFLNIRLAWECNYKCLGITCDEMGELFDGEPVVFPGTEKCDDVQNGSTDRCAKSKIARRKKCKTFIGKSGVKNRITLSF